MHDHELQDVFGANNQGDLACHLAEGDVMLQ